MRSANAAQARELAQLKQYRKAAWEQDVQYGRTNDEERLFVARMHADDVAPPSTSTHGAASTTSPASVRAEREATASPPIDVDGASAELRAVVERNRNALWAIFRHYCFAYGAKRVNEHMTLKDLTRLVRDCQLHGRASSAVIQLVFSKISRRRRARGLDIAGFVLALAAIAETVMAYRVDLKAAEKLDAMLVADVLPNARRERPAEQAGSAQAAVTFAELEQPAIRHLFKQHTRELRKIYAFWADDTSQRPNATFEERRNARLTWDRFSAFATYYQIVPFIAKRTLGELFRQLVGGAADGLSYAQFVTLLGRVALHIYSQPLYAHTYPTPESRVRKLLVKLIVLKQGKEVDARGNARMGK